MKTMQPTKFEVGNKAPYHKFDTEMINTWDKVKHYLKPVLKSVAEHCMSLDKEGRSTMRLEDLKIGETYKINIEKWKAITGTDVLPAKTEVVCIGMVSNITMYVAGKLFTGDILLYNADNPIGFCEAAPVEVVEKINNKRIFYAVEKINLHVTGSNTEGQIPPTTFSIDGRIIENTKGQFFEQCQIDKIEVFEMSKEQEDGCKCSSRDLVIAGCKCGYIEKERMKKNNY